MMPGERAVLRQECWPIALALIALVLCAPQAAQAHVSVQTIALLAGTVHPWMTVDSALLLAGLSMWLAQNAVTTELRPFITLACALTAGVAGGVFASLPLATWLASLGTLVVGISVGVTWQPPLAVRLSTIAALAALAGWCAGADAAPDMQLMGSFPAGFLIGVLAGGFIFPLALAGLLAERRQPILRIGFRVLGGSLAATGLILLALRLRGQPGV